MEVYIAVLQENDWETEPFNIGVYSTKEKAENAILDWLRNEDSNAPTLSLEIYASQGDNANYTFGIEKYTIDD